MLLWEMRAKQLVYGPILSHSHWEITPADRMVPADGMVPAAGMVPADGMVAVDSIQCLTVLTRKPLLLQNLPLKKFEEEKNKNRFKLCLSILTCYNDNIMRWKLIGL